MQFNDNLALHCPFCGCYPNRVDGYEYCSNKKCAMHVYPIPVDHWYMRRDPYEAMTPEEKEDQMRREEEWDGIGLMLAMER